MTFCIRRWGGVERSPRVLRGSFARMEDAERKVLRLAEGCKTASFEIFERETGRKAVQFTRQLDGLRRNPEL